MSVIKRSFACSFLPAGHKSKQLDFAKLNSKRLMAFAAAAFAPGASAAAAAASISFANRQRFEVVAIVAALPAAICYYITAVCWVRQSTENCRF